MNLKEALKRIEELERRVKQLESTKPFEHHIYYHSYPQQPIPVVQPVYPTLPQWPTITC